LGTPGCEDAPNVAIGGAPVEGNEGGVDGVAAGGAFIPQVQAISLNNVERIEVLRGATPVFYGTTAFAGTINVIHYPAGRAQNSTTVRYGSYNSGGVEFATDPTAVGASQSAAR
jgi:outer membrane receptor protein involved in Fe transport